MNANFAFTLKLLCHFVTPLLSTEEELVLLAEDGELLSSPSGEDRRRACSESVERKVVRVRFGLNTAKPGGSSLIVNLYISFLYKILYLWHKLRMERWQRKI
ncbi:MAG: hypothetical protein KH112_02530 [Sanguibacteroides justesenii]|nr:hypothetical protein [Sanguibacteroides justesenii]